MASSGLKLFRSSKALQRILVVVGLVLLFSSFPRLRDSRHAELDDEAEEAGHLSDKESGAAYESRPPGEISKALVVASMKSDDTSWFRNYFPDWQANIYVMDDPWANLTVDKNKGRESTAYLTFLIDNYHNLPDIMVFLHALRFQWHNEDPMYDGVPMVRNLQLDHVREVGYANLRCTWVIGCPVEIKPMVSGGDKDDRAKTEAAYARGFQELFPDREVPEEVGIQCGAQFALAKEKVLERPREDYMRYRQWLWDTNLPDNVSGRILEYSWHIIMGKPAVHCPPAQDCFCAKYGLCNLTCKDDGSCEKRYRLPQYSTIPPGWPEVGPGTSGWPAKDWYL